MIHVFVSCGPYTATIAQCLSELYDHSTIAVLSKPQQLSQKKTIDVFFFLGKEIAEFDRDPRAFKRNYGLPGAKVVALGVSGHETILEAVLRDPSLSVDSIGNLSTILAVAPDFKKIEPGERRILYSYLPGSNEGEEFRWSQTGTQSKHSCFVCNTQPVAGSYFREMSFWTNSEDSVQAIIGMLGKTGKNLKLWHSEEKNYHTVTFSSCFMHRSHLDLLKQKTEVKKLINQNIVNEVLSA